MSNITKQDNGTRCEILVTNRFGQTSASILLDVACNYLSIFDEDAINSSLNAEIISVFS